MRWSIPEKVIEAGRQCVAEQRVLSVVPVCDEGMWHAEVRDGMTYQVFLDGSTKECDQCQCAYWQQYGYCEHTVAVELYLRQQNTSRVLTHEVAQQFSLHQMQEGHALVSVLTDQFFQQHHVMHPTQRKQQLNVFYELRVKRREGNASGLPYECLVSLRVGVSRLYHVSDLAALLQAYELRQAFAFKNGVSLDWGLHYLNSVDEAIWQRLIQMCRSSATVRDTDKSLEKKWLSVSALVFEELITACNDTQRVRYVLLEQEYDQAVIHHRKPTILVHVSAQQDALVLHGNLSPFVWLAPYRMVLHHNHFYRLSADEAQLFQRLSTIFAGKQNKHVRIDLAQQADFFNYALPMLRQIATVVFDESLAQQIIDVPLVAQLSLHFEGQAVRCDVSFRYQQVVFTAAHNTSNRFVVRDVAAEQTVLQALLRYGFMRQRGVFRYLIPDDAALYGLLFENLERLSRYGTIELDAALSQMKQAVRHVSPTIQIRLDASWLSVGFDMADVPEQEVAQVVTALLERRNHYQLPSGQFLVFDEDVQRTIEAVTQDNPQVTVTPDGHLRLPLMRGLYWLQQQEQWGEREASVAQLLDDLRQPQRFAQKLPAAFHGTLRDYQRMGYGWLRMLYTHRLGGILADDMGLGKTIQVIAFVAQIMEQATEGILVVAPASLLMNWQREFARFAPSVPCVMISGNPLERSQQLAQFGPHTVLLTSYQTLRQDVARYHNRVFDVLILDESQIVKNSHTQLYRALRQVQAHRCFALSGTPVENRVSELWAICQLATPGLFGSFQQFRDLPVSQITKQLAPFILRRTKEQVLADLPAKVDSDVFSPLNEAQKALYIAYLQQIQQGYHQDVGQTSNQKRLALLAGLTRLRQICCDPRLIDASYTGRSAKLTQLMHLLDSAQQNGHRVLVFSQFASMLQLLAEELAERDWPFFMLTGSTPLKERHNMVTQFNEGARSIFLVSLKAGGTGLNLTGADVVVLYDLWWDPAVEEQATSRAHRIGQARTVQVYRLIAEGTIEEKIHALQQQKKQLFEELLQDEGVALDARASLSDDELRDILGLI